MLMDTNPKVPFILPPFDSSNDHRYTPGPLSLYVTFILQHFLVFQSLTRIKFTLPGVNYRFVQNLLPGHLNYWMF